MKYGCYEYSDLPSSYRGQANCSLCENLRLSDTSRDYYGKELCRCKAKGTYVKKDGSICDDVLISRSNYSRLGSYRPGGCYITTIVCEILGYKDNCEILNVMREFRDNFLKINYIPILLEYDQVGPIISERLRNDEERKKIALESMKKYLLPCGQAYKNGNPLEALNIYQEMIKSLKIRYNLETYEVNFDTPYDINTVGKGRVRINKNAQGNI